MKKLVLIVLAVIVLATPIISAQIDARGTIVQSSNATWYEVVTNDNLWNLVGPKWPHLIELNPWLDDDSMRKTLENGKTWVLIRPNDKLFLDDELVAIMKADNRITLLPTAPPSQLVAKTATPATGQTTPPQQSNLNWWFLSPVIALALAFIVYLAYLLFSDYRSKQRRDEEMRARELEMNRPVETAGPPMVPNGIQPHETVRLTNFFDQQAAVAYRNMHPGYDGPVPTRIGPIENVALSGEGEVKDRDGKWHPRRFDTPRGGYQALYRNPDGTEVVLQAFQVCMNIVREGGGMRGFTATRIDTVVAMPQPAQVTALHAVVENATGSSATIIWGNTKYTVTNGSLRVDLDKNSKIIGFEADGHVRTSSVTKAARPKAVPETKTGT